MSEDISRALDRHLAAVAIRFSRMNGRGLVYSQTCCLEYVSLSDINEYLDPDLVMKLKPLLDAYDLNNEYVLLIKKVDSIEYMGTRSL
jgi:hypothetical protein